MTSSLLPIQPHSPYFRWSISSWSPCQPLSATTTSTNSFNSFFMGTNDNNNNDDNNIVGRQSRDVACRLTCPSRDGRSPRNDRLHLKWLPSSYITVTSLKERNNNNSDDGDDEKCRSRDLKPPPINERACVLDDSTVCVVGNFGPWECLDDGGGGDEDDDGDEDGGDDYRKDGDVDDDHKTGNENVGARKNDDVNSSQPKRSNSANDEEEGLEMNACLPSQINNFAPAKNSDVQLTV
ncbi:hypothetical protein HELRODRAFT_181556 [Helobdella robusta]|uniref:Uncharacterized protein n=1 Tax=Helobdella robusta TaxID=6412 RepID=T1FH38_HELRO|nr:hypothetical protein HELRODRAFT_181556 [Helobdella robusta]ESN92357.1 hypothetical protein HELRODRAFT_181556 [Helobdella robusta]